MTTPAQVQKTGWLGTHFGASAPERLKCALSEQDRGQVTAEETQHFCDLFILIAT